MQKIRFVQKFLISYKYFTMKTNIEKKCVN